MEALCGVFGGGRVPIVQAAGSSFLLGLRRFGATTEPRHAALTPSSPRARGSTHRLSDPFSTHRKLLRLDKFGGQRATRKTQFSHSEHSAHLKRLRESAAEGRRAGIQYTSQPRQVRAAPRLLCSRCRSLLISNPVLAVLALRSPPALSSHRSARQVVPATPRCHATSSVRRAPPAAHARGERRVERSPAGGGAADEPEAALATPLGAAP